MVNLYEIATSGVALLAMTGGDKLVRNDNSFTRLVKRRRYEQDKESEHFRREMYYAYTS